MKKIFLLFVLFIFLVGCEKKEKLSEKFYLDEGYYNNSLITEIDSETINAYIKENSSFALFIYTPGCSSCQEFEIYLNDFSEKYQVSFLKTTIENAKETNISKYVKYTPSVVLYQEGKLISYLDAASDKDLKYYESTEDFKVWLDKYIYLENINQER